MMEPKRLAYYDDKDDLLAREIIRENTGEKDPELTLTSDFLDEIDLRLEQVKLYYPIMEMIRKRKTEDELVKFVPELCLLTLSYLIYEGKLKHQEITFQHIEAFLGKAIRQILARELMPEEVKELTAEILDGLQNGGRNFVLPVYNFKTGNFREKYVKFLEIKPADEGILHYSITEQGVDFYLKTKEFPEETKITVNLLLFQKQMDKGAFGFAYETVRRLNMEVQKKKDKKYSLLEALMYGRLDSGEAYNSYHQGIALQFEEEAELFNAAMQNVNNVYGTFVERINNGEATPREIQAFTLIKIIEKEISRAQTLHTELLRDAAKFTKEYDQVLSVRRKALFTDRFNFQGEFERLITQNRKAEALKFLFEPLLTPKIGKSFNPLSIFVPQRMAKSRREDRENEFDGMNADRETLDDLTRNRVRRNFIFYAARLLEDLYSQRQMYLKDFCTGLIGKYGEESVYNGDFISFIVEINRDKKIGEYTRVIDMTDGKIVMDRELKTMVEVFVKAALVTHLEGKMNRVIVQSFPEEELELLPGLKITNMVFTGE